MLYKFIIIQSVGISDVRTHIILYVTDFSASTNNPEEYFRISVFIPYLYSFISQLKSRFLNHIDIFSTRILQQKNSKI